MIARTSVGAVSRQACACTTAVGSCLAIARMILARLPRSALAALLKRGIVSTGASAGGGEAWTSWRWLTRGASAAATVVVVGLAVLVPLAGGRGVGADARGAG